MADWRSLTDRFLDFNERQILTGAGSISKIKMETIVHGRYEKFNVSRRAIENEEAERAAIAELEEIEKQVRKELGPGSG
jgi:hypothetical protein